MVQDHGRERDITHGLVYCNEDGHIERSAESGGEAAVDRPKTRRQNKRDDPVHDDGQDHGIKQLGQYLLAAGQTPADHAGIAHRAEVIRIDP